MPFVPPTKPAFESDALGGINAVIMETDDTAPSHTFHIKITTIEGVPVLDDPRGERVFFHREGVASVYRFLTDSDKDILPVGISVLHVLIDGNTQKKFYLSVASGIFKTPGPLAVIPAGVSLSKQTYLAQGDNVVEIRFAPQFIRSPVIGLGQVIADMAAQPPLAITANLVLLVETRMVFELSQAPNSGNYRLAWTAWA